MCLPAKGPCGSDRTPAPQSDAGAAALTRGLTAAGREVWNSGLSYPGGSRPKHPPPERPVGWLMFRRQTHRNQTASVVRSSGAKNSARELAAGHRSRLRGEPGPPPRTTGGKMGPTACGPAHQKRTDCCWLDYSTRVAEKRGRKRLQAAKSFSISAGSATACGVECSRPWAPTSRCCMASPMATRRIMWVRAAPTWSHYARLCWRQGPDGFALMAIARFAWLAVDGAPGGGRAIRSSFSGVGALQGKPPSCRTNRWCHVSQPRPSSGPGRAVAGLLDRTAAATSIVHAAMEASGRPGR